MRKTVESQKDTGTECSDLNWVFALNYILNLLNYRKFIKSNRIFTQLLDVFEKRRHETWKVYARQLRHKYAKEMEEAWHLGKIEPLKEELSREEFEGRRSALKKLMKYLEKVKKE